MTDVSNLSGLADCIVEIEVTGMLSHTKMKGGTSIIKVPLSSLSRTMQFIHRSGGKIVEVTRLSGTVPFAFVPTATTTQPAETPAVVEEKTPAVSTPPEPTPEPVAEAIAPEPTPDPVAEAIAPEPTPETVEAVVETAANTNTTSSSRSKAIVPKTTKSAGKTTTKRAGKKKK
jgi:hypothetical protein